MIASSPNGPDAKTRIECDVTGGYNAKPGIHVYEFCPFCGHRVIEGDGHQVTVTLP